MESGLSKNQILSELSRSPHGKLAEYIPVGKKAAAQEPEFLAHLIAWDHRKGQIRDAKVALPLISLSDSKFPEELVENSLAHLSLLGPRELLKAYRFSREMKFPAHQMRKQIKPLIEGFLRGTEKNWNEWQHIAIQHRHTLKELYALNHLKPSDKINTVLFGRHLDKTRATLPKGSIFEKVAELKNMTASEAAGTILEKKIPFLIAMGALGSKAKDPDLVLALIKRMSATELVTNTKMLERLGVKDNPILKGAYSEAIDKASSSSKNVLKTTRAAEQIGDEKLKSKLRGMQDKQLSSMAVEGDWLVLGDKSASMSAAIETSKQVAATLAKMVKGKVHLVFFDTSPQTIDVTGMSLDVIQAKTKYVTANGGTSIGCGLQRMLEGNIEVDGIAIISDAAENTPPLFVDVYKKYCEKYTKEVPVYLYRCKDMYPGHYATRDLKKYMAAAGFDLQEFNIENGIDYYSLPNLVATMRTNRYSLIDEVMETPLLTLKDVFKFKRKEIAA